MLSYATAFRQAYETLQKLYDPQEASAITNRLLEYISGLTYTQRLMVKDDEMPAVQQQQFNKLAAELYAGRPLQYVLGYEWFMSRQYKVNEQVLIPRPETEELVQWIIDEQRGKNVLNILDIGSGSGCIPISLKLALESAIVSSCDISSGALAVAKENAASLGADIDFLQLDFLNDNAMLGQYDIIVSNPPYIPKTEKDNMHSNVKDHEPSVALFVPGSDPLLFYKAIAAFGLQHLKAGGAIYCELHIDHAMLTKEMFADAGYETEIRKDMHGNLRMLKAGR